MDQNPNDDLQHIRSMMERSSRFISLSGLSGVVAGLVALAGAGVAYYIFEQHGISYVESRGSLLGDINNILPDALSVQLLILAAMVLVVAIGAGAIFTIRKSKKAGLKIWTSVTRNLIIHLLVPLIAGGIFCVALLYHGQYAFVAPATLVFYGLALVNAAKFTYSDIQYLGFCEIFLGLVAMFLPGYGLIFWGLGFGLLHIIYGIIMYRKYK